MANAQELGGSVLITQNDNAINKTIKDFSQYSPVSFLNGSVLKTMNKTENTKGKRYVYDDWVKGTATTEKGEIVNNPELLFNFDKMTNDLLITQDKNTIIQVNKDIVKSFTLINGNDKTEFERVGPISSTKYLQVISKKDGGHALYKLTSTKFVKANYQTNGLSESGNPYDEYVDNDQYFVVPPGGKEFKIVNLKQKSIKAALTGNEQKVNEYFYKHAGEDIDGAFLKGLVDNINQ